MDTYDPNKKALEYIFDKLENIVSILDKKYQTYHFDTNKDHLALKHEEIQEFKKTYPMTQDAQQKRHLPPERPPINNGRNMKYRS